jgi:4-diphosphocytidyl-2-C-methyl-D-erythritol kinase
MKQSFELQTSCPAKLNLFLKVGHRRDDGYHAVNTIMTTLALSDTLIIRAHSEDSASFRLSCQNEAGQPILEALPQEQNLVTRAFRQMYPYLPAAIQAMRFDVTLVKRIAVQAGLGGGSSNAASMMLALNRWASLPETALLTIGQKLGADVVFFLLCGLRHQAVLNLTGRGDVLAEKQPPVTLTAKISEKMPEIVLIKPHHVGVSTKEAYCWLKDLKNEPKEDLSSHRVSSQELMHAMAHQDDVSQWPVYNDFEPVMQRHVSAVAAVMSSLKQLGAPLVLLCGSGAAVAGFFQNEALIREKLNACFPADEFTVIWTRMGV